MGSTVVSTKFEHRASALVDKEASIYEFGVRDLGLSSSLAAWYMLDRIRTFLGAASLVVLVPPTALEIIRPGLLAELFSPQTRP